MIKFEHIEIVGWEAAIRGMRNPMNSWKISDSEYEFGREFNIGKNDGDLMCLTFYNAGKILFFQTFDFFLYLIVFRNSSFTIWACPS